MSRPHYDEEYKYLDGAVIKNIIHRVGGKNNDNDFLIIQLRDGREFHFESGSYGGFGGFECQSIRQT